jgi:hypothetical protein
MKPGVMFVIVSHDPWCPMAYGEGTRCAGGCHPLPRLVNESEFAHRVASDFRNRAQRRAEAKRQRRAGGAR